MKDNVISLVSKREEREEEVDQLCIKYLEELAVELRETKRKISTFQIIFVEEIEGNSLIRYGDAMIDALPERIGLLECAKNIVFHMRGEVEDD